VSNSLERQGRSNTGPAHPRRRRTDRPATDKARLLLAKLLSTLLGALVGFFLAHLISIIFAGPFQTMLVDANGNAARAKQRLAELDPDYVKARDDYNRLNDTPKAGVADTAGEAAGGAAGAEHPGAAPTQAAERQAKTELERARKRFYDLREERDREQKDYDFWEAQIAEHKRNINQLDMLSAAIVLILALAGYAAHPLMLRAINRAGKSWAEFFAGPEPRATQAVAGFFAGLILAIVLLLAIFNVFGQGVSAFSSPPMRLLFGTFVVVVMGIAGALVGMTYFTPQGAANDPYFSFRKFNPPHLLDTSVIIDGRIHDVAASGFIGGVLVVTNSVLRELQSMSDSGDERKRNKGRRGLELLRKMQDDPRLEVRVFDDLSFESQAHGTDEQLIIVGQAMGGVVVTNDYNLNRVAAIRDVRVININALANAVKTNLLPGDMLEVHIIDRGKQRGQGVAYLDDGTMVVIEDGESYLRQGKLIKITSVTQTVQGRLIFGRVDAAEEELAQNGP
jgi:uncharacterized protein YacL